MEMKTTVVTGKAPNLPWWKALSMSDDEIAEYNKQFLKEVKIMMQNLTTQCMHCNKDYPIDKKHECVGKPLRIINIDKVLEPSVFEREIWNKAIEAAALHFEKHWVAPKIIAAEIRSLKK